MQEGEYFPLGLDEAKKSDARIVASTNVDLWQLQEEGRFRKDLNYRLRTHRIYIPPLRERKDDIPLLLDHFIDKSARTLEDRQTPRPGRTYHFTQNLQLPGQCARAANARVRRYQPP